MKRLKNILSELYAILMGVIIFWLFYKIDLKYSKELSSLFWVLIIIPFFILIYYFKEKIMLVYKLYALFFVIIQLIILIFPYVHIKLQAFFSCFKL
jgi:cytochrome bd-type quinol oxidase subunit 2